MPKPRTFISFDFDHDEDLPMLLAGQAKNPDSPFEFTDRSLKEALTGDWITKIRNRIANTDLTIVICGAWTHTASGVSVELRITRELRNPYFLLAGRSDGACNKPASALPSDKIYKWTWDNLKLLIQGNR